MNLGRLLRHETILAVLLAVALILLARQSDRFFTTDNLLNQGRLMAEVGLVALPMTFIIVTGGIDLSWLDLRVGGDSARRVLEEPGRALPIAMVAAVLVGDRRPRQRLHHHALPGPPLIATLATLALYRGLAEGISQARSVRGYPDWFFVFGQGELLGVPSQLWLLVILAIAAAVMLGLTTFGRTVYAIGSNETAARFSGLHVDRAKMVKYYPAWWPPAGVIFVSRLHHPLGYGHGAGARRHHRGGAGRDLDLRGPRHDHRHGARPGPDAGVEGRPLLVGGEGRWDDRGDRPGADRRGADRKFTESQRRRLILS
jgi:rhamnose transport system permease protein